MPNRPAAPATGKQWPNHREATVPRTRYVEGERDRDGDKGSADEKMIESRGASLLTSAAQGLQAD